MISGNAVAGVPEGDDYRSLSSMGPGDFFGEIGALTGGNRTANVVATDDIEVLEVTSETEHLELQLRWKDRDGEPRIVEVSHVSRRAREAEAEAAAAAEAEATGDGREGGEAGEGGESASPA